MTSLILFLILAIVALVAALILELPRIVRVALFVVSPCFLLLGLLIGSSVVVPQDKTGIVMKHVGEPLASGSIIAAHDEQGPQAKILGPGWHFGYWPGLYDVDLVDVMTINHGELGFVTARDGKPLPPTETFAPAWDSATDMLNPETFLAQGGCRGPQTTVLPPGTYRFHPTLHQIQTIKALVVGAGQVAVIKANTGKLAPGDVEGAASTGINGIDLVDEGFRGIWKHALKPGAYYLNTQAYGFTLVKTTQRVYTYQQALKREANKAKEQNADWSVVVRSKDGFSFPIDVRVGCAVEAKDAPYLVALLGDPDKTVKDDQEDEELEILEAKVILPSVRAIFRNVAETMNALEFVNARSTIEKVATERMRTDLAKFRVTCDGVYVGNIHLDANDSGRKLLATQTDKEVAVNQQNLYAEQKKAEESRSSFVKAQEEAEQQRNLAKATYEVLVKEQGAKARAAEAKGEADYQIITGDGRAKAYEAMVKTLGREQVAQLELLKLVAEGKIQPGVITPQVMVTGSAGSTMDALAGTLLRQTAMQNQPTPAPAK